MCASLVETYVGTNRLKMESSQVLFLKCIYLFLLIIIYALNAVAHDPIFKIGITNSKKVVKSYVTSLFLVQLLNII